MPQASMKIAEVKGRGAIKEFKPKWVFVVLLFFSKHFLKYFFLPWSLGQLTTEHGLWWQICILRLKFPSLPLTSAIFIDIYFKSLRVVLASVVYNLKSPFINLKIIAKYSNSMQKVLDSMKSVESSSPPVFMVTLPWCF